MNNKGGKSVDAVYADKASDEALYGRARGWAMGTVL